MSLCFLLSDSANHSLPPSLQTGEPSNQPSLGTRILVVDDEAIIADTIVQILNRNGFQAEAVYGGHEAVEVARQFQPEIILSDVLMPHLDGVEAAIAIRELFPGTRVVLFSGQSATVEILARARARGYDFELLPKPIHPTTLLRHLRDER